MFKVGDRVVIDPTYNSKLTTGGVDKWKAKYGDIPITGTVIKVATNEYVVLEMEHELGFNSWSYGVNTNVVDIDYISLEDKNGF